MRLPPSRKGPLTLLLVVMAGRGDPARYSPAEFVSRGLPPTLVIQGEEDTIVLARDAGSFCAAAEKAGGYGLTDLYTNL
jgi:acetyl esterase/lipase